MSREYYFYETAYEILFNAGHYVTFAPLYCNLDIREVLFARENNLMVLEPDDFEAISKATNISLLCDILPEEFDEPRDGVSIFSLVIDGIDSERSLTACQVHRIVHRHQRSRYSIAFIMHNESFVISIADGLGEIVLSDWFTLDTDCDTVSSKIDVSNISLTSARDYYYDFRNLIARAYYDHELSLDYVMFDLLACDKHTMEQYTISRRSGRDALKEYVRELLLSARNEYGDDFIEPYSVNGRQGSARDQGYQESSIDISEQIDRMCFELELEEQEEQSEELPEALFVEGTDETLDDMDLSDAPAEIFMDPVKMVTWLEQHEMRTVEKEFTNLQDFFTSRGFRTIDKRKKGGCFWVIGSQKLIEPLASQLYYDYDIVGYYASGKTTNHEQGWYTTSDL